MIPGDAEGWVDQLADRLRYREAQYRRACADRVSLLNDPEELRSEATAVATFSVIEVFTALLQLPQFAGGVGLLPLHDLVMALGDLANGNKPAMLQPRAGISRGEDTHDKNYIKKQVVAGVEALKACGLKQDAAAAIVAREFANAGVRGRQGGRLSKGTVIGWIGVLQGNADVWTQVQQFVWGWKNDNLTPSNVEAVTAWVRTNARSPEIQSKI